METLHTDHSLIDVKPRPRKLYIDQYGNRFYASTRKELKAQIPGKVSLMYVDKANGDVMITGYVIGAHWLTEYVPNERPAK